jgi:squalene-hopene/tetraprenyl-beta-curcumene cyclase
MRIDPAVLDETLLNARWQLLNARVSGGYWEGELSSSALSTATALYALALYEREKRRAGTEEDLLQGCQRLCRRGIEWLLRTRNEDGGWGDTVRSISNISTTALCWAALSTATSESEEAVAGAEEWLIREAGSLKPAALARAVSERYGKDRTFSVPILTTCALAGRLGARREAWRHVPGLPFELAACPQEWFRWLRLPVVSYALPALIAIGQAAHCHRPSTNPAARLLRSLTRQRTLRVLEEIQPSGGGFLEAVPLTSFVVMSLVASGQVDHPVVRRGVDFLIRSARNDGSWAIDTNLATWLTTLSINALAAGPVLDEIVGPGERRRLCDWLLGQQYREVHPYTRAAPGGWAWTDLSGGVPDADDTAGALLALRKLAILDKPVLSAAASGIRWLLEIQNQDGGVPTFCRGWGALPFDRSGADLTAHALLAWTAWRDALPADLAGRVSRAIERSVNYLAAVQTPDGAWSPLWFGNQEARNDENPTYGTARVLPALLALDSGRYPALGGMRDCGIRWLLNAQNQDGGWGGDRDIASSVEETALALNAVAQALRRTPDEHLLETAMSRGANWLIERTARGRHLEPSPIGFYFARLWYYERLYPLIFTVAALTQTRSCLWKR